MPKSASSRFLLWIDAVGGFLVCSGERVVLGQAVPGNEVDVPLQAELSRRHATIQRDGESYVLLTEAAARVDGRPVDGAALLSEDCLIELGPSVALRFRRPHPLSATACVDLVSRHRTVPASDGILLLAQSCVVGSGKQCHVVAPAWRRELILFRQGDGLQCRVPGRLEIDGVACQDEGPVTFDSRIRGDDFSLSLESLD